jgi:hypothetical protein
MNTLATDTVVIELTDDSQLAERLVAWAERTSDVD